MRSTSASMAAVAAILGLNQGLPTGGPRTVRAEVVPAPAQATGRRVIVAPRAEVPIRPSPEAAARIVRGFEDVDLLGDGPVEAPLLGVRRVGDGSSAE